MDALARGRHIGSVIAALLALRGVDQALVSPGGVHGSFRCPALPDVESIVTRAVRNELSEQTLACQCSDRPSPSPAVGAATDQIPYLVSVGCSVLSSFLTVLTVKVISCLRRSRPAPVAICDVVHQEQPRRTRIGSGGVLA